MSWYSRCDRQTDLAEWTECVCRADELGGGTVREGSHVYVMNAVYVGGRFS
jgi:hypothetical protein